jgi:hypothetical protein
LRLARHAAGLDGWINAARPRPGLATPCAVPQSRQSGP